MTVACGEDALEITRIQLPGKKPMAMGDVLNGHPGLFVSGVSLAALTQP
jgi:methionyl-tRNA formyltransferase